MFLIAAIAITILWILGAFVFRTLGGLVHLLLLIAVVEIILHFVRR